MKKIIITLILVIVSIYLTYTVSPRPYQVHYHANMAVYIDWKAWDFSRDIYMEEVARCNVTIGVKPEDRIHLHENKWDLVHVHMAASTWGDLYANLLWNFGSGYLIDDYGKVYTSWTGANLYYILNGERIDNPHNRAVASEDTLLIWYGTWTIDEVMKKYPSLVSSDAHEYNNKEDPASCSTNEHGELWGSIWANFVELFPHSH